MPDQISPKLGAYLDGELDRRGQNEVRAHLETCPACRAELEELRNLSRLLRAAPLPEFIPTADFKAQLMLQLPRSEHQAQNHERLESRRTLSGGSLLPWLAPALVLVGWIFFQGVLGLTSLAALASQAGLLEGVAAWVSGGPQQMLWFATAQAAFGGLLSPNGQAGLTVLNDTSLVALSIILALLWQVGAALLYWGVLTLLWHNKVKALWPTPVVD